MSITEIALALGYTPLGLWRNLPRACGPDTLGVPPRIVRLLARGHGPGHTAPVSIHALNQLTELLLRAGRGRAAFARLPGPADQGIFRHVLVNRVERAPAVARRDL